MQWAHNSSAAALSHQVSDLRMWSCENVNYTTRGPGCVSSTCDISRRLFNIWYCRISSRHHDTSIGLTNSTEIPWCAVLFWKNLWRTLRSESSIQSFVSQLGEALPAVSLGNHACLVFHSNPPLGKQTATPNSTIQMAPRHLLLGTSKSEETLEPGLLHLTSVVHSQITNFN